MEILCKEHNFIKEVESIQFPDSPTQYFEIVHFWCTNEGCWRSKEFAEIYPMIVDALKPLCLSHIHRLRPESHSCADCDMSRDMMMNTHDSSNKAQYRMMWENAPVMFTLPRDIDSDIIEEFSQIYKKFLKNRLGLDLKEGGSMPGWEDWVY